MHMRLTSKNRFLQICFKYSDLGIFHDALPCDYNTIRPGPGSSSRAHHHLDRQYCTNITDVMLNVSNYEEILQVQIKSMEDVHCSYRATSGKLSRNRSPKVSRTEISSYIRLDG